MIAYIEHHLNKINNMSKEINFLKNKLSKKIWNDNDSIIKNYLSEERGRLRGECSLLLTPQNTNQVVDIIKICNQKNIGIVPQGGRTGLSGGSVPIKEGNEVILSLEKMNKVIKVNKDRSSMIVQAGCRLSRIKETANKHNRYFPVELASKESCTIGGNISTNAGGTTVLKYGMTRDLVLGLEVVLPNGDVIQGLREIKKDNRAYDLKHLFIGAEGTIGVVTAAALKLFPIIQNKALAIVAVKNISKGIDLLNEIKITALEYLSSFELNSAVGFKLIKKNFPEIKLPFNNKYAWYIIIELSTHSNNDLNIELSKILKYNLKKGNILDFIQSKNKIQANSIWQTRELLNKAQKMEGPSIKHDISIPLSNISSFIRIVEKKLLNYVEKEKILIFGHLADGNLHYNIKGDSKYSLKKFENLRKIINNIVFEIVYKFQGSFSAEHGIGVFKMNELLKYSSKEEYKLKKSLKYFLDPKGIMNSGKIFPNN